MISILERRQKLWIDTFNSLPSWQEKYAYLIELGENDIIGPEYIKTPLNRLKSCLSESYFSVKIKDGVLQVLGISNGNIPSGIIALVKAIFDGISVDDLRQAKIFFHIDSGLMNNLTGNRRNSLEEMISRIKNISG